VIVLREPGLGTKNSRSDFWVALKPPVGKNVKLVCVLDDEHWDKKLLMYL